MKIRNLLILSPVLWSILIFIVAQALAFTIFTRENAFLTANQIYVPPQPTESVILWPTPTTTPSGVVTEPAAYSTVGPILIYFLAVVVLVGFALFIIPMTALRMMFKVLFAFLFAWATFIVLIFWLPWVVTLIIAGFVGSLWFFMPRVWLHNIAMILAMVSLGVIFGRLISPWTAMVVLLALAVYDFFAVRFGYMMWMAKKLTRSNTLPAFFIPKRISAWSSNLNKPGFDTLEQAPVERQFSILGGGDIGLPLLVVSSVYFARGLNAGILLSVCSLIGLLGAYWIQATFLKGKPIPALPPIAVMCLAGLLLARFI